MSDFLAPFQEVSNQRQVVVYPVKGHFIALFSLKFAALFLKERLELVSFFEERRHERLDHSGYHLGDFLNILALLNQSSDPIKHVLVMVLQLPICGWTRHHCLNDFRSELAKHLSIVHTQFVETIS